MKGNPRWDEMCRAAAAARQQTEETRAILNAVAARPAEAGDVYLFPGNGDLATRWVVLGVHPDQPQLVFAVPGDGHPLFGLADLALTLAGNRRLTLRCGLGLWLPRTAFASERRIGILSDEQRRAARAKMRQVLRGTLDGPEAAHESEANPDYQEWIGLVAAAVEHLAIAVREPALVVTQSEFRPTLPFGRPPVAEAAPLELAAASAALEGAAANAPVPSAPRPLGLPIDLLYPGEITLLWEPAGIAILYATESGTAPPLVFSGCVPDGWQPLTWAVTPGGSAARAFAPWAGDALRLRFGEGSFSREVTIARP